MTLSVLTLVRGREAQLTNLVRGVNAQDHRPDELVIAAMQEAPPPLPFSEVPIRTVRVTGARLPLAAARNAAARTAQGDALIFLDVDCIPTPSLCRAYRTALGAADGCFMGEVRYLPSVPPSAEPLDFAALSATARRHVAKPAPPAAGIAIEPDHGELWGLSFALTRATFERAGGFDEAYVGYGGEETDFARRLAANGVPLYRVADALALHQPHAIHIPPLHHFDDILANAKRFRERWGAWPMDYWLAQFAEMKLIRWERAGDAIERVRAPSAEELAASRAPEGTLYS